MHPEAEAGAPEAGAALAATAEAAAKMVGKVVRSAAGGLEASRVAALMAGMGREAATREGALVVVDLGE